MSTENEILERVLGKLLVAGWLSSFTFTICYGWQIRWTPFGEDAVRAVALVSLAYGLDRSTSDPMALCNAIKVRELTKVETMDLRVFTDCAEEIGACNEDELQGMVRIALMQKWVRGESGNHPK